jgi:hypothetical protein
LRCVRGNRAHLHDAIGRIGGQRTATIAEQVVEESTDALPAEARTG